MAKKPASKKTSSKKAVRKKAPRGGVVRKAPARKKTGPKKNEPSSAVARQKIKERLTEAGTASVKGQADGRAKERSPEAGESTGTEASRKGRPAVAIIFLDDFAEEAVFGGPL